jgi:PASTA domain
MAGQGRRGLVGLCALAAALVAVPSAQAAITGSHVTQPTDPRYIVNDEDAGGSTLAVKGTTTGGNPAVDKVDLLCFQGTDHPDLASNVPLDSSGKFSVPAADLSNIEYMLCRLRAVPAGTVPANLAPFAGPLLGIDHRETSKLGPGPNLDTPYDFYIWAQQRAGAFDYESLTGCGIDDGYLNDSTLALTTVTFFCNAWLAYYENFDGGANGSTRSELRIDGANAYGPYAARSINPDASPGFPAVTYSFKVNPLNGTTTIHESEPLVKCPDATFPPTEVTCAQFVPTGVRAVRTIVQDHDGHLSTITDVFKSTDHKRHQLDLLWQNDQHFFQSPSSFDATTVAYRFPGQGGYSTHVLGDTVTLPKKAPASILVKQRDAADGNTATGRGAITYGNRSTSATFNRVDTNQSDFYLHQAARIPKGGKATFRFAYSQAFDQKTVNSLARFSERRFRPCTVPRLKGKTLRKARRRLRRANCRTGKVRRRHSATVDAGHVIRSRPRAGKKLEPRARVKLVVSSG